MAAAIRDPAELIDLLELDPALLPPALSAAHSFPLVVPRSFVARMRKGDPNDPLLLQVLPLTQEHVEVPGFLSDPVGDLQAHNAPGVLHKYHGRTLLITTGACAVHCRYCFRRHFPYSEANAGQGGWRRAVDYLGATPSITEVILSGGDPLMLSDRKLTGLIAALDTVPHLSRLRIHSRLPVVLPSRVDRPLLRTLRETRLQTILVIHANHANELNTEVEQALARLKGQGIVLLNQAVLLRNINDELARLLALSERLFAMGVLPYYLHLLDRVAGAAHFAVDEATAVRLHEDLRHQLPGYLVPRLVREVQGAPAKCPLPLASGQRNLSSSG